MPPVARPVEDRRLSLAASALLGAAAMPFAVLALFGRPRADDFIYFADVQREGVLGAVAYWHRTWIARYFTNGLTAVCISLDGHGWFYNALAFLMFAVLWLALWRFIASLTRDLWPPRAAPVVAAWLAALFVVTAPSPEDAFYWMISSCAYTAGSAATLWLVALFIDWPDQQSPGRATLRGILCAFLAAVVIGSNEAFMLQIDLALAAFTLHALVRRRPTRAALLACLLAAAVGSCIVLFAPGNAVRLGSGPVNRDVSHAFSRAALMSLGLPIKWLASPALWGVALLLTPALQRLTAKRDPRWFRPRVLLALHLIWFAWLFAGHFTAYYSLGHLAPKRLLNAFFLGNMLFAFASWFLILGIWGRAWVWPDRPRAKTLAIGMLAVGLAVISRVPAAVSDLVLLPSHLREMNERDELLRSQIAAGRRDLVLPAFTHRLTTLCYEHLENDSTVGQGPEQWLVRGYAAYLGADTIRIVPRIATPLPK
jgi:hypothetical protein